MEWIIVDRGDSATRRLEAVRLADGETRGLLTGARGLEPHAVADPAGRWIAARAEVDGAPRCALIDLREAAVRWVAQSLDAEWQLEPVAFDDAGRRLLMTGRFGPAAANDLYVVEIDGEALVDAEGQALIAGAQNPERMGLWAPQFAPGGASVIYLQRGAGDLYAVVVLDVGTAGDSMPSGRAPSRRTLALTEPMRIAPEGGLAFGAAQKQLYFAYLLAGKQRLARKPLTGQPPRSWWRSHTAISSIDADPDGAGVAYVADGQVLWADLELDDVLVLSEGPVTGAVRCAPDGWVLYLRATGEGVELRAIHRPSRSEQTVWTSEEPVAGFFVAPPAAAERLAALPAGPLPFYAPDPAALAARREAEEAARREAEEAARREAEEAARREAEEAARREAEAAARREAQREAEEAARREAERRAEEALRAKAAALAAAALAADAQREAEEAARLEAQREAEEAAQREAEEAARAAAEEAARAAAEEAAQREAEQAARRQAEEAARAQAEEAAQREAEEAARAAAEEAARRAAQREAEQAARAAEREAARRRTEEAARRRAEEATRRRAEQAAKREAEQAARAKARREAEEAARAEAEAAAQREAEEAARAEAEAAAQREAEDAAQREADEAARAAAERDAEQAA
ncbi:MAG: hypothetical protein R3F65_33440, partial [bacterium]